ncbi:MAG: 30S ribosomal protein S18 [Chloroflexi bacterium]|nr:30S ribosomal protein S18 [Chloroflexota bacterium]MDK1045790.1 30S ribosomal protein S18 [Anaerolineales bacterium]MCH8093223.1 30S ribosomal protein S18 [Chloroflexota bacterium]MCH8337284.1 30S ribosomal protein S18 [Chloroflexota bacterium]MCH8339963.1 30S ribosomal protein S18 [Chloroflexota bacterium]
MATRSNDGPRRRFKRRPRTCQFCADPGKTINYKVTDTLKRLIKDTGKIRPRRDTGTCAKHQRALAKAIKQSRHMALMPFTARRYR